MSAQEMRPLPDGERLAAIREWAATGIMSRTWPLGDGTAVMLNLRRELLLMLDGTGPDTKGGQ